MLFFLCCLGAISSEALRTALEETFAWGADALATKPLYLLLILAVFLQIVLLLRGTVRKWRATGRLVPPPAARRPRTGSNALDDPEQAAMMDADQCIVVDEDDVVLGHDSKKNCHLLAHGLKLHRAFSIFIFDDQGRLLLQKRAATKITFPLCWANTCCSHPLYVDGEIEAQSDPDHPDFGLGAKRAAQRKLLQELGVRAEQVPLSCMTFMTRLHYRADLDETWGEHEVDYLIVCRPPGGTVDVDVNPNEVDQARWFTQDELQSFCRDHAEDHGKITSRTAAKKSAGFLEPISPWFAAIEKSPHLLHKWWGALLAAGDAGAEAAVQGAREPHKIHRAGTLFYYRGPAETDVAGAPPPPKQRVCPVHKHSKWETLTRPRELVAAVRFKIGRSLAKRSGTPVLVLSDARQDTALRADLAFCEHTLNKVSRSFAAVIAGLHAELRVPVAVFYLVLRALDTIEDETDLTRFAPTPKAKNDGRHADEARYVPASKTGFERQVALLATFHTRLPVDPRPADAGRDLGRDAIYGIGEADERVLLERLGAVLRVFHALPRGHREVVHDITRDMAAGMVEFAGRDLAAGSENVAEYNRYCHFVAGLVGLGLTRQFVASGLEDGGDPRLDLSQTGPQGGATLANSMGLFLQKTNIIRDYLEDLIEGRSFWPKAIWSIYSPHGLDKLTEDPAQAVACLNHMVTDALQHGRDSLAYLDALKEPSVFKFCAIPQVMAIATMAEVYAEPRLFTGVLKIRKSLAALIMQECNNMADVRRWFAFFASNIVAKVDPADPNAARTIALCKALGGKASGASCSREVGQGKSVVRGFLRAVGCWCGFDAPAHTAIKSKKA